MHTYNYSGVEYITQDIYSAYQQNQYSLQISQDFVEWYSFDDIDDKLRTSYLMTYFVAYLV